MFTVLEENYNFEYSEVSNTGNVQGEVAIEGYQYCVSLERAFKSLISQQYTSFILTVQCKAVVIIYCADNGNFKVFDSSARDVYGNSHPQGTCVPLYLPSVHNLELISISCCV